MSNDEKVTKETTANDLPDGGKPEKKSEEKAERAGRVWQGPQWEYHRMRYTETAKYDPVTMEGLGIEGWELVTVYKQFTELNFIFKRPKQ